VVDAAGALALADFPHGPALTGRDAECQGGRLSSGPRSFAMPALQRLFARYFGLTETSLGLGFPEFGRALSDLRTC